MFMARYEDLTARPHEVLTALFRYCKVKATPSDLDVVLGRDAREGTGFSRAGAQESSSELTEERRLAFLRSLAAWPPGLDPECVIPGTYGVPA